jgi:serine/threonine protein kinase
LLTVEVAHGSRSGLRLSAEAYRSRFPEYGGLEKVLPLLDRLVDSLTILDQNRVLHRDIKPSNVLVDRNGHVWLNDFGLARLMGDSQLTAPGGRMGTDGFMSPEQWDGREDIDGRTDVFSLGATI